MAGGPEMWEIGKLKSIYERLPAVTYQRIETTVHTFYRPVVPLVALALYIPNLVYVAYWCPIAAGWLPEHEAVAF